MASTRSAIHKRLNAGRLPSINAATVQDPDLQAALWKGMAKIYRMQGHFDRALRYYEKLLIYFQGRKDGRAQAMTLYNIDLMLSARSHMTGPGTVSKKPMPIS
jgi:tetratricopeptide (TPR) repeat protein